MTWRRGLLLLLAGLPLLVAAIGWWALHTTSGARFVVARVEGLLGDRIGVGQVGGTIGSGLEIERFRYAGAGVTVTIGRFAGEIGFGLLPLTIELDDARASDVGITVRPNPTPGPRRSLEEVLGRLVLPFELYVHSLDVQTLEVSPTETASTIRIDQLALAGSWTERVLVERLRAEQGDRVLQLAGTLGLSGKGPLDAELELEAGPGLVPGVEFVDAIAAVDGDLRGFGYEASGDARVDRVGAITAVLAGEGDFGGIVIESAEVSGAAGDASLDGRLDWSGGFGTELSIALERFAVDTVWPEWPDDHPVSGTLDLRFDGRELVISNAALATLDTDAELNGSLRANLETDVVEADLGWRGLEWPIAASEPRIASDEGQATLSGTFDDWQADGTVLLSSPGLPSGRFGVDIRGSRTEASGRIVEGDVLGGHVSGTGAARWEAPASFSADVDLDGIRTGVLWPEWPGIVSGHIVVTGQAGPLRFDARLDDVRGTLRGWPLEADGQVALRDNGLAARDLAIRHGESELRLDGGIEQPGGVQFQAEVVDIGTYVDAMRGDLEASGSLAMMDGEPALVLDARSNRFTVGNSEFVDSTLDVDATRGYQVLEFRSLLDDQLLRVGAEGVPDSDDAFLPWNGTLTEFSLEQQAEDAPREIRLVQSAPLRVSADAVSLERACLQGSIEARLCVGVDWRAGRLLGIVADLDSIAVDRINQFVDTGFVFDQHVTGEMRWEKAAGQPLTAFAELDISAGTIRNEGRDGVVVRTGDGAITFDVQDGALLQGDVRLPLPGTGNVEGRFSIADIADLDNSAIDGSIDAELTDIGPLRMFLPDIDHADGRLTANVVIDGTARSPLIAGDISLDNGEIEYRPIGLTVTDIEFDATFDERRHFELVGEFRAGDGQGTLASSGSYGNGFTDDLVVEIRGERLKLIDVPDLEATANADLRVGFDDGLILLDGRLVVPRARISPRSLPATRHSESEDVVVVAGELPDEEQKAPSESLRIDGQLVVGLGDDVVVDVDLAEAKVTGSVTFKWDRNLMPMATGRYEIAGDIQAYGQVLTITEGTVRFSNVPANNPSLRMRAEREIFGNSQIKSAGILIGGTVKRPTVEPYTDPRTTRERALTLLVTGSDFDMEQGVGAIDFGTYIAPRLFVSYGIGLFDQENVISARYDLGKGFGVKATSGQKESGIDLIYHVER